MGNKKDTKFSTLLMLITLSFIKSNAFGLRWCDPNGAVLNFSYIENNSSIYKSYLKPGQCWQDKKNNAPLKITLGSQYTGYPGMDITIDNNNQNIFIVPCKNAQNGIALFSNPAGSIDTNTCGSLIAGQRNFYNGQSYCSKDGGKTAFDVVNTASCYTKCKSGFSNCVDCYNDEYDFSEKTCWNR